MSKNRAPRIVVWMFALYFLLATRAFAGPPYLTDDPEPTEYTHWENYLFTMGDYQGHGNYNIYGPAAEINYGAFPDTQVSLTIPMTWARGDNPPAYGFGDLLFGVKYRFVHETNGWPQIAFYPAVTFPTGEAARGLGNGTATVQLPIWAQKSWGPWTTYGGGGAMINSAVGHRDYGFLGWLVQRDFGQHLTLGAEIYAQGRDTDDDQGTIVLNFGGSYKFDENFSLLASAGHSIAGQTHTVWYFAVGINW